MSTELIESKEKIQQNSQISIATSTYYPEWYQGKQNVEASKFSADKVRGDLFLEMAKTAKEKGFQLTIVDASNNPDLSKEFDKLSINTKLAINNQMGPSRQQAFKEASKIEKAKVVVWTEPEKISMVKDCLPQAALPILLGKADIVIPERDSQGFSSYPNYQSESERSANQVFNKMLYKFAKKYKGLFPKNIPMLDLFFGVRLFKNTPELLEIFTTKYQIKDLSQKKVMMNPDLYNNALNFPIIKALNKGYKVTSIEVPYIHPKVQTELEEDSLKFISKRKEQFNGILKSCAIFCRYLAGTETRITKID